MTEYFVGAVALLLLLISGIIMAVNVAKFTKEQAKYDDKNGD